MLKNPSSSLLHNYSWLRTTLLLTSLFLLTFWLYFFLVETTKPNISSCYLSHEYAFVMPDLVWIVGLLLFANYWLKHNNLKGITAATAAGGALVFLALIDISYNLNQGLYSTSDGVLNGVINCLSLGYGITLVYVGYKLQKHFVSMVKE